MPGNCTCNNLTKPWLREPCLGSLPRHPSPHPYTEDICYADVVVPYVWRSPAHLLPVPLSLQWPLCCWYQTTARTENVRERTDACLQNNRWHATLRRFRSTTASASCSCRQIPLTTRRPGDRLTLSPRPPAEVNWAMTIENCTREILQPMTAQRE